MSRWTESDIPDQSGRLAIVTGANTGVGFETARALAAKGARVILACRSEERGKAALERLFWERGTPDLGSRQPGLGPGFCDRTRRRGEDRHPGQQRGRDDAPGGEDRRWLRAADRRQLHRPLRADRPSLAPAHGSGVGPRDDRQQLGPSGRQDSARQLQRSEALLGMAGVPTEQVGVPHVRHRAPRARRTKWTSP